MSCHEKSLLLSKKGITDLKFVKLDMELFNRPNFLVFSFDFCPIYLSQNDYTYGPFVIKSMYKTVLKS